MKKLTDYQALIVDLDGTLYYQRPVRRAVLCQMLLHFWRCREFIIVKKYRELYAQGCSEKERLAQLPENAPSVIQEWMIRRPMPYIAKHRDSELIRALEMVKESGIPVIVYSDYPVKDKLVALGFVPSQAYSADDIGCLKPDASGLLSVLRTQGLTPERCLVIGDRADKDGALAQRLSAEFVLMPARSTLRRSCYKLNNLT